MTFVTDERIIVAPEAFSRIAEYGERVQAHRTEAVYISRTPCGDGKPVTEGVYFCPAD